MVNNTENKWEGFLEKEIFNAKRKKLNNIIKMQRERIESHLNGKRDRDLESELEKKQLSILNTSDTLERFMYGILKVDLIADAIYEPKVRNIDKKEIFAKYLTESNTSKINILGDGGELGFFYNKTKIVPLIFTPSSGENEIRGKFTRALKKVELNVDYYFVYNDYNTCETFVRNIENGYPNIKFLTIDKFIEQCLK